MQPKSLWWEESAVAGRLLKALTRICDKVSVVAGLVGPSDQHYSGKNVLQGGNK
jgi:glucose-6-phosphate dehydrogenase assembly protein OpcA